MQSWTISLHITLKKKTGNRLGLHFEFCYFAWENFRLKWPQPTLPPGNPFCLEPDGQDQCGSGQELIVKALKKRYKENWYRVTGQSGFLFEVFFLFCHLDGPGPERLRSCETHLGGWGSTYKRRWRSIFWTGTRLFILRSRSCLLGKVPQCSGKTSAILLTTWPGSWSWCVTLG